MRIVYFSPTGNVKYLAGKLAGELNLPVHHVSPMESVLEHSVYDDPYLVIMYSIHGFNAPRFVKSFVNQMPKSQNTKIALLATGCTKADINSAATASLKRRLQKKGYRVVFERIFAMPLTIVTSFPDDLCKKLLNEAVADIRQAAAQIKNEEECSLNPKISAKILSKISILESAGARIWGLELHSNKKCTSCGICVKNCPTGNIHFNKKYKPRFGFKCLMCLRCIYSCPEKAISPWISRFVPIKGGYNIEKYLNTSYRTSDSGVEKKGG